MQLKTTNSCTATATRIMLKQPRQRYCGGNISMVEQKEQQLEATDIRNDSSNMVRILRLTQASNSAQAFTSTSSASTASCNGVSESATDCETPCTSNGNGGCFDDSSSSGNDDYSHASGSSTSSIGVNLRVTGQCSQGGRKYMEDYFSVAYQQAENEKDLEYAFIGIYDGHGGAEAATFAKEHLMMEIISQKKFWSDSDEDVLRAIREGYIATHYAMWRDQDKWPKTANGLPSTAGTTATVAFIRRGKLFIGHVGDSGIVLGYQNENEKFWRAKQLTVDHKPESNAERIRIQRSGGKVIVKSGVPRVVWSRPKNTNHRGPIRHNTPVDEIPFLAVARSLGDLWSYNSACNEFVVSPDPDVTVVKINPKTFKCLIFGTDGLWNVVTPQEAVDCVYEKERINLKIQAQRTLESGAGEGLPWTNPSKGLVEKALKTWSTKKMRADNTSVVTVILYPPGNSGGSSCSNINACPSTVIEASSEQRIPVVYSSQQQIIEVPIFKDACTFQDLAEKYLPPEEFRNFNFYEDEADENEEEEEDVATTAEVMAKQSSTMAQVLSCDYGLEGAQYSAPSCKRRNDGFIGENKKMKMTTPIEPSFSGVVQGEMCYDMDTNQLAYNMDNNGLANDDEDEESSSEDDDDMEDEKEPEHVHNGQHYSSNNNASHQLHHCSNANASTATTVSSGAHHHYMGMTSTFAESYNSLLSEATASTSNSSHTSCQSLSGKVNMYEILQEQQLYQQQCMSEEEGYSLTKLVTRGEQQRFQQIAGRGSNTAISSNASGVQTFKIFHHSSTMTETTQQQQVDQTERESGGMELVASPYEASAPISHDPAENSSSYSWYKYYSVASQKPLELNSLLEQEREEEQQVALEQMEMQRQCGTMVGSRSTSVEYPISNGGLHINALQYAIGGNTIIAPEHLVDSNSSNCSGSSGSNSSNASTTCSVGSPHVLDMGMGKEIAEGERVPHGDTSASNVHHDESVQINEISSSNISDISLDSPANVIILNSEEGVEEDENPQTIALKTIKLHEHHNDSGSKKQQHLQRSASNSKQVAASRANPQGRRINSSALRTALMRTQSPLNGQYPNIPNENQRQGPVRQSTFVIKRAKRFEIDSEDKSPLSVKRSCRFISDAEASKKGTPNGKVSLRTSTSSPPSITSTRNLNDAANSCGGDGGHIDKRTLRSNGCHNLPHNGNSSADLLKRTLRTRNSLSKDMKAKAYLTPQIKRSNTTINTAAAAVTARFLRRSGSCQQQQQERTQITTRRNAASSPNIKNQQQDQQRIPVTTKSKVSNLMAEVAEHLTHYINLRSRQITPTSSNRTTSATRSLGHLVQTQQQPRQTASAKAVAIALRGGSGREQQQLKSPATSPVLLMSRERRSLRSNMKAKNNSSNNTPTAPQTLNKSRRLQALMNSYGVSPKAAMITATKSRPLLKQAEVVLQVQMPKSAHGSKITQQKPSPRRHSEAGDSCMPQTRRIGGGGIIVAGNNNNSKRASLGGLLLRGTGSEPVAVKCTRTTTLTMHATRSRAIRNLKR